MGGALRRHAERRRRAGRSSASRPASSAGKPTPPPIRRSSVPVFRGIPRIASARSAACSPKARNVVHLPPTRQSVGGTAVDLGDEMIARDAPGEARLAARQRPDAAVAIDDVLRPHGDAGEDVGQRLEDVVDLVVLAAHVAGLVDADVGRAEQHPAEIGEQDADAAVDVLEVDHVAVEGAEQAGMVEDEVRALGAADERCRPLAVGGERRVGLVQPGAGGVDDQVGRHREFLAGQRVGEDDPAALASRRRRDG